MRTSKLLWTRHNLFGCHTLKIYVFRLSHLVKNLILSKLTTLSTEVRLAERSKAPDLSSGTRMSAWVRTPHLTIIFAFCFLPFQMKKLIKSKAPFTIVSSHSLTLFDYASIGVHIQFAIHWDKEQQSKAQNSDSKYRQMALAGFDT